MGFAVSTIAAIALLALWLVAEFCWSRAVRVGIGLGVVLYLCYQIWATASSADVPVIVHGQCVGLMERLLREGREPKVRQALRAYREGCDETHDEETAVFRMLSVLQEPEAGEQRRAIAP